MVNLCLQSEGQPVGASDATIYRKGGDSVQFPFRPRPQTKRFHLRVLEPVSKPNVTAECLSSNFTLSCSSSRGSDVEYIWEVLPPCGDSCFVRQGSVLEIDRAAERERSRFTCTAQNHISAETSAPLDLGMCIPFLLTGALIYKYRRIKRQKHVPDTGNYYRQNNTVNCSKAITLND
ncbi:SLAM family member 7-like [Arapaima gigas]